MPHAVLLYMCLYPCVAHERQRRAYCGCKGCVFGDEELNVRYFLNHAHHLRSYAHVRKAARQHNVLNRVVPQREHAQHAYRLEHHVQKPQCNVLFFRAAGYFAEVGCRNVRRQRANLIGAYIGYHQINLAQIAFFGKAFHCGMVIFVEHMEG